jgi:hypothetical protein
MAASNAKRTAPGASGNGPLGTGELIGSLGSETKVKTQATSHWRQQYRVHPVADLFPMMSDDELAKLGKDINANGLLTPIMVTSRGVDGLLADGRNRLEAMERAGINHDPSSDEVVMGDLVSTIIGLNIRRRHLSKHQQADLIVAAHKAAAEAENISRQDGEKIRGRPIDKVKAAAIATAKALPDPISERTIERSFAKAEGKQTAKPKLKPTWNAKPKLETHVGIDAARKFYLDRCADPGVDLDAEMETILDALREIAGKRAMARANDGQMAQIDLEELIPAHAEKDDDLGDIPGGLDRRRQGGAP